MKNPAPRLKRLRWLLVLIPFAVLAWMFRAPPLEVESAVIGRGPLAVTVDEEGTARLRDRLLVSAPLTARLLPPVLRPGDAVKPGDPLAALAPVEPALLDARSRAQAEAQVRAAEASARAAEARAQEAREAHELAERERARLAALDAADTKVRASEREHDSARYAAMTARFQLDNARAALRQQGSAGGLVLAAPAAGVVLRVYETGGGVVPIGTPLIEIGDPRELEAVIPVLSTDGVRIEPGAAVELGGWGAEKPLAGRVRRIEPAAFTRVSALGVEEQRVNVIVDLLDPPERRARLGDGFRVEARIAVWSAPAVLRAPAGALFRSGDDWSLFVIEGGRARLRRVTVGKMNDAHAEILEGLKDGERVIVYPGDKVSDGARVKPRVR